MSDKERTIAAVRRVLDLPSTISDDEIEKTARGTTTWALCDLRLAAGDFMRAIIRRLMPSP